MIGWILVNITVVCENKMKLSVISPSYFRSHSILFEFSVDVATLHVEWPKRRVLIQLGFSRHEALGIRGVNGMENVTISTYFLIKLGCGYNCWIFEPPKIGLPCYGSEYGTWKPLKANNIPLNVETFPEKLNFGSIVPAQYFLHQTEVIF